MQNEADKVQNQDIESLSKQFKSLSTLVGQINTVQGQHTESLNSFKGVQDGLVKTQGDHSASLADASKKIEANQAAIQKLEGSTASNLAEIQKVAEQQNQM